MYTNAIAIGKIVIGLTSLKLRKIIKEQIPKCVDNYMVSTEKETKSVQINNAIKTSSIAEHMENNHKCAEI